MRHEPQFITAPGNVRMVLITEEEYRELLEAREDAGYLALAVNGLQSIRKDGSIPADVLYAIQDGAHPVAAWRAYRGLSQAQLADKAGISQAAVARIESAKASAGRPDTRKALATALDAPLWTLTGEA